MPLLTPITDCDEATFLAIAAAKRGQRKTRLQNAWPSIKKRYQHYESRCAILETLVAANLTTRRASDCKHCYDLRTKPVDGLIARVLKIVPASGSTMCQYCLIGEIDSVDHYAPKDLFPEFSVFPRNLVASCSKCNRLKSSKWLLNGVREIANLYFDDLPTEQYLYVEINCSSGTRAKVSFVLRRPSSISQPIFSRITNQFRVLDLIERYNTAGAEYVGEVKLSCRALGSNSESAVKTYLRKVGDGFVEQFGANYMKALICHELADNDDFMTLAGVS